MRMSTPSSSAPAADIVIADTRHWIEQAVIGLNLCPFARAVYVNDQIRYVVSHAPHVDGLLEELDRELEFLAAADPAQIDTTLLIHPTLLPDFLDFNEVVGIAEEAVEDLGYEGVLQVASFHPRFQFADTEPDAIENFTNRAPYPTFHLLREDSLTRAIANLPDPDDIYRRNIDTLRQLGHAGWNALGIRDGSAHDD